MLDLDKAILSIIEFCKTNDSILLAYLFGSYHDGFANQNSDLDLAILFKENINLWNEMALQAKISEVLRFDKVDLINLNKAPLRIQFNILSTGRLIYEANKDTTDDYVEKVLNLYHDREIRYKNFLKEIDESLREDYLDGQY